MAAMLGAATPILRIFDLEKAHEFYVGYLGYAVDWEHHFEPMSPSYMQISRDRSTLHLSEHHGDGSPGQKVRVIVEDVADFHRELMAKTYRYMRPALETAEWGERAVTLHDPFGTSLVFYEKTEPD